MTLTFGFVYEDGSFEVKKYPYLSEIRFLRPEEGYLPIQIFANCSNEAKNYYGSEDLDYSLLNEDDFDAEEIFILEYDTRNPIMIFEEDSIKWNLNLHSLRYFMFNKLAN